jgi:multidrug efflux pump subunit AcrA (membrane-fusion protein)
MFSTMTAIPPPVQTVLDLFTTKLADVRFGDVDAETLARLAAEVACANDVLAATQAALDEARAALQARQEALLQHAQRALAYARVYAEADEELAAQLDAVALPRVARRPRADEPTSLEVHPVARRRGRPRKAGAEPLLDALEAAGE